MNVLAGASATQFTDKGKKGEWLIRDFETTLWILPSRLTEQEVMHILKFGRAFELKAFNEGIKHQKKINEPREIKALQSVVRNLQMENKTLLDENERIGSKLDELLTSKI